jgi:hypothetical protein
MFQALEQFRKAVVVDEPSKDCTTVVKKKLVVIKKY